jgi:hypothetical protein
MAPADECLGTANRARPQVDDGLVVHEELLLVERDADVAAAADRPQVLRHRHLRGRRSWVRTGVRCGVDHYPPKATYTTSRAIHLGQNPDERLAGAQTYLWRHISLSYRDVLAWGADDAGVTRPESSSSTVAQSLRRLARVRTELDGARAQEERLRAERDALLVDLVDLGVRYAELADAAGLTEGRIAQLVGRARER